MNDTTLANMQAEIDRIVAGPYRLLLRKMHLVPDSDEYLRWEGEAAGIRETTTRLADAAGLTAPDWHAIRASAEAS